MARLVALDLGERGPDTEVADALTMGRAYHDMGLGESDTYHRCWEMDPILRRAVLRGWEWGAIAREWRERDL